MRRRHTVGQALRAVGHTLGDVMVLAAENVLSNLKARHAVAFTHCRDNVSRDDVRARGNVHWQVVRAARHRAMDRPLMDLAAMGASSAESGCYGLLLWMASVDHLRDVTGDGFLGRTFFQWHCDLMSS